MRATFAVTLAILTTVTSAQQIPKMADVIPLKDFLVIRPVGRASRTPMHQDPVEAMIVQGKWKTPAAGDAVTGPMGEQKWEEAKAGMNGALQHRALGGGYAYCSILSDARKIMVLEASGHGLVYVNGELHTGDPYSHGYVHIPVQLKQGPNDFLFQVPRGQLNARLVKPKAEAFFDLADTTLPDFRVGETAETWAGIIVANATANPLKGLEIHARTGTDQLVVTPLPTIPPTTVRKVPVRLKPSATSSGDSSPVELHLIRTEGKQTLDTAKLAVGVRKPEQSYKRTFISKIDGSVQYYAVNPSPNFVADKNSDRKPALFLTLHGAGVEAIGQANAYSSKAWGHIVAPTNRRPYGFDWEDWGRLDAIEVLELAKEELKTDPTRTYLTGHSMGGHGAWIVGATFPDRFAAIGPSAGWISFWSYAGGRRPDSPNDMQQLLLRAMNPSDTMALAQNYLHHGVYILHGEKDDNVPVGQARSMKQHLTGTHFDFMYHEQPGAGHWWENSDEPGAECVDWPAMFDFFAKHSLPPMDAVRQVDFVTASPAISSQSRWLTIEAQLKPLIFSSASIRVDPGQRRFVGTTENVARLKFDVNMLVGPKPLHVELDGQKLTGVARPDADHLWLSREEGKWKVTAKPTSGVKGPHRYGPFREVLQNRMVFVYGTRGSAEENAWTLAKARYDAETFWYRGNGAIDIIADTDFDNDKTKDRNVILYGNAETNAAWQALLGESPVQVRAGSVRIGDREEKGDDLACVFVRPRPGSNIALVGAISGSGLIGMKLADRLPYFVSGVAYPDCVILGAETLEKGNDGVRAAGFFGLDWSVAKGEWAWKKKE